MIKALMNYKKKLKLKRKKSLRKKKLRLRIDFEKQVMTFFTKLSKLKNK
jgi:hypothetical protein